MKIKLLALTVAVLAAPLLARAGNLPNSPGAACTHVPSQLIILANAILASLGLGPIC